LDWQLLFFNIFFCRKSKEKDDMMPISQIQQGFERLDPQSRETNFSCNKSNHHHACCFTKKKYNAQKLQESGASYLYPTSSWRVRYLLFFPFLVSHTLPRPSASATWHTMFD